MMDLRWLRKANRRRRRSAHGYGLRRDHGRKGKRPLRIVRLDDRRPHAHLVVVGGYGVWVVEFDARGRQMSVLRCNSTDEARTICTRSNQRLRRKR